MENKKLKRDLNRTKDVITSCTTPGQLEVGVKMYNRLNDIYDIPEKDIDILKNLIGLMRLKCGVEDVNEGMSSIGKEFRKHSSMSGVPELQKIVYSEGKKNKSEKLTPEVLSKKHDVSLTDIKKEISVGTKIEMEHTKSKNKAKKIAMDHILEFPDYYTDPKYGIIAIEKEKGKDKKTIRISKKDMDKLHKNGEIVVNGVKLVFPSKSKIKEDFNFNRVSLKNKKEREDEVLDRVSKSEIFDKIRNKRFDRRNELENLESEEIEEATGSISSGQFTPSLGDNKPISRTFKKSEIPISVNGIDKPIGKIRSFKEEKEILGEEELDEETSTSSISHYVTPKFWAKGEKNWRGRNEKTYGDEGKFVNINEKCKTFPYCDQGSGGPSGSPITLTDKSEMKIDSVFNESFIVKKSNLKLKNK